MTQPECSAALQGSPMQRAKLRGPKHDAAAELGKLGDTADTPMREQALAAEPRVREHAAWALAQLGHHAPTTP